MSRQQVELAVGVYIIIETACGYLMLLRKNTGYEDGLWAFPAGHCERRESATQAVIREAKEEVGIDISPEDVEVVHVMHDRTNRDNVRFFFRCKKWSGEIQNTEPHKAEKIAFFAQKDLPNNIVPAVSKAFACIHKGIFYSESGF
ncbi:MAG: hypothetical protein A2Y14_03515 [Verrucomicrobia bacterium GWF2_51_19]|nr:MAG: hypothetical protein A2Y14_03515 [Verrucomicrobia bacterium GWF2_51_19]HCJ12395.1 NUDIX hydrolase [Opitutae bacterium]